MNYPCLFFPSDNFEQRLVLPTRWRASVHALFYCYWLCDPRRCEIKKKVSAQRRVSMSEAPHIVTWIKQTWINHQCTSVEYGSSALFNGVRHALRGQGHQIWSIIWRSKMLIVYFVFDLWWFLLNFIALFFSKIKFEWTTGKSIYNLKFCINTPLANCCRG